MEKMSVFEILQLIRINESAISTQFQVWLTITFSTIVAVFAGKNLLTRTIKWLVTCLYLLASLATVASSIYLAESHARLSFMLAEKGEQIQSPLFASISYFVLFFAGICTTIYFIHMEFETASEPAQ